MNTGFTPRNLFSASRTSILLNVSRKTVAIALAYLMIPLGIGDLYAQEAPPPPPDQGYEQGPPPQAYTPLSFDELDQLVAPIALYPDALVAQILAASTYPDEVAAAEQMVEQNPGVPPQELGQMADEQNWDPSVKSLVAFPSVLNNLSQNYQWADALGNAYYNQPQDVMTAVQTMRARAYASGDLRSNQYIGVDYAPGNIIIAPINPAVVYVPWYNPWVVYGSPVVPWGGYYVAPRPAGLVFMAGLAIGFGVGIAMASWNHWGWGYHNWGMGWRNRTVVYQRNVYISRSVHVTNHGYYGHFDRTAADRRYNQTMARRAPNFHPVAYNNRNIGNRTNFNNRNNRTNFNRNQTQFNRNQTQNRTNNFNRNNNVRTNNTYRPAQATNRNFNRQQPTANRPQNRTQFNRTQPTFNRNQNNSIREQQNFNRQQERPQQNVNRQEQNFNREQQNINRQEERPQENFNRQESRPQQNVNRQQNRPRPQANRQEKRAPAQHEDRGHGRR